MAKQQPLINPHYDRMPTEVKRPATAPRRWPELASRPMSRSLAIKPR